MNKHKQIHFKLCLCLVISITSLCIAKDTYTQTKPGRPKIGLTLSGGGAKGIAHIGILKALDSAGLKVDYITGTSMGSIVGALYAVGYSGNQIEKFTNEINWNDLLSNQSDLRSIIMEEKDEYRRYAIELPYQNHGFNLPTGVVESEELWLKFSELFFPVNRIKSFDQFSIPFKCIATNAANGEMKILEKGEIVQAVRASMAIPSFFTAVNYDSIKLVDGGIVRNFPVSNVREMGADFVIGVNVTSGLTPAENLNNPISILMNTVFFKESEDSKKEIPLCNIYIPMPVESFSTASFNKSTEIMDTGVKVGLRYYPRFKAIADSLDEIYGKRTLVKERIPKVDSVFISQKEIKGLKKVDPDFFDHLLNLKTGKYYTSNDLSRKSRKLFGTRYFNRITYVLEPLPDGSSKIIFTVDENPISAAKAALHYNSFMGVSIILNFTTRNFLTKSSRSLLTMNVGENFRIRGEHMQYLGNNKNFSLILGSQFERLDINTYREYRKEDIYRQTYFRGDVKLQYSWNRKSAIGIAEKYEYLKYKPSLIAALSLEGQNRFFTSSLYYKYNTLDRNIYPRKGAIAEVNADWIYGQSGKLIVFQDGAPIVNTDSLGLSFDQYYRLNGSYHQYLPIGKKGTFEAHAQAGFNMNYSLLFLNDYLIGGLVYQFRNQIVFAGYPEGNKSSGSISALQLAYRYEFTKNLFLSFRTNGLFYDIIYDNKINSKPLFLSGHALSFAYLSTIGPIEFSVMYGDQSKKFSTYVNIGLPF